MVVVVYCCGDVVLEGDEVCCAFSFEYSCYSFCADDYDDSYEEECCYYCEDVFYLCFVVHCFFPLLIVVFFAVCFFSCFLVG